MNDMFKQVFTETLAAKSVTDALKIKLYDDVLAHYHSSSRHYHNINHLDHLTNELLQVKEQIACWHITVFAIAYHDVIYNILKQNNEEKSAGYATRQLTHLLTTAETELLTQMIMATKTHAQNPNEDINYFTDADLSVLGAGKEDYVLYTKQIRKEYQFYPAVIYKPGREKVIRHFLTMNRIFKTSFFYNKYESAARLNLTQELIELTGKR